jgi:hypothetical protein
MRNIVIENNLKNKSYQAIEEALKQESLDSLLALLDAQSNRIGDVAAQELVKRRQTSIVVNAILSGDIRTKRGKIRSMFVLKSFGRHCEACDAAYLKLMRDRSFDVARDALFG